MGGTLEWKLRTGAMWAREAHARGLRCHVGRVGSEDRIRWALRIEADSIDSALPLFSEENLERFLSALEPSPQLTLLATGSDNHQFRKPKGG